MSIIARVIIYKRSQESQSLINLDVNFKFIKHVFKAVIFHGKFLYYLIIANHYTIMNWDNILKNLQTTPKHIYQI